MAISLHTHTHTHHAAIPPCLQIRRKVRPMCQPATGRRRQPSKALLNCLEQLLFPSCGHLAQYPAGDRGQWAGGEVGRVLSPSRATAIKLTSWSQAPDHFRPCCLLMPRTERSHPDYLSRAEGFPGFTAKTHRSFLIRSQCYLF